MISALFVEKNGVYFGLDFVDPWDAGRDARKYVGFNPVVAHPPCQKWGKMAKVNFARYGGAHNVPWADGGCFYAALAAVRINGGVLEHPAQTYAWNFFGLTKPKKGAWVKSIDGIGWTCEVWQSAYGHKANKATWLYYVGKVAPFELRWERPVAAYQIGFHDQRGKDCNKPTLGKKEANATPVAFRDELLRLAEHSRQGS